MGADERLYLPRAAADCPYLCIYKQQHYCPYLSTQNMCRSPPTSPHEVATGSCSIQDTTKSSCDSDSDFSTEDMLKRKNTELHELQAQMLRMPRAERKQLKTSVDLLDKE